MAYWNAEEIWDAKLLNGSRSGTRDICLWTYTAVWELSEPQLTTISHGAGNGNLRKSAESLTVRENATITSGYRHASLTITSFLAWSSCNWALTITWGKLPESIPQVDMPEQVGWPSANCSDADSMNSQHVGCLMLGSPLSFVCHIKHREKT